MLLHEAAPECRNREIASLTVPQLVRLYSPGGPLHCVKKGTRDGVGEERAERRAAACEARQVAGGEEQDDRASSMSLSGGVERGAELRQVLWGWLSSAAQASSTCDVQASRWDKTSCSASEPTDLDPADDDGRQDMGQDCRTGGDSARDMTAISRRMAKLRHRAAELMPLIPLLKQRAAEAAGEHGSGGARGDEGGRGPRSRGTRRGEIASAYSIGAPQASADKGAGVGGARGAIGRAVGSARVAVGACGAGKVGMEGRRTKGEGSTVSADVYSLLGGTRANGMAGPAWPWEASAALTRHEGSREVLQAQAPQMLRLGCHWVWKARHGDDESARGGSMVANSAGESVEGVRACLEMMVPPRGDVPTKGLVAGRGTGGGGRRSKGCVSREDVDSRDEGGARAADITVVPALEERDRMCKLVEELRASVSDARAHRIAKLRAVAADLSRCSGVEWRGL